MHWPGIAAAAALMGLAACGPVDPSPECVAWSSCIAARDSQLGVETDNVRFEPGGGCWGSAEGAELCTNACESGLDWMRQAYDDLPDACLP